MGFTLTLGTLDTKFLSTLHTFAENCTRIKKLLKNSHKYFTFTHNSYIFSQVIINIAKYIYPEYLQNFTFGSPCHCRTG